MARTRNQKNERILKTVIEWFIYLLLNGIIEITKSLPNSSFVGADGRVTLANINVHKWVMLI